MSENKFTKDDIMNILLELGIPVHLKGFDFLQEALLVSLDNPNMVKSITRELYPYLAKQADYAYNNWQAPEHAIRTAITKAFKKPTSTLVLLFPQAIAANRVATNQEFLARVLLYLQGAKKPTGLIDQIQNNIIEVEGFKAFRGTMRITPVNHKPPFEINADWLYKPDSDCWYGAGGSFAAEICEIV